MKRLCLTIAAMAVMMGTVGSAAAVASPTVSHHPTISKAATTARLAKLESQLAKLGNKRLSAKQLKAVGLHPAASKDVAIAKRMAGNGQARVADIGTQFRTWQYAGVTWIHSGYAGPYYSYPWYPYYVMYNEPYICTWFGSNCQQADTYFVDYLVFYYPNQTWYWYGPDGDYGNSTAYRTYSYSSSFPLGYGPYAYQDGGV